MPKFLSFPRSSSFGPPGKGDLRSERDLDGTVRTPTEVGFRVRVAGTPTRERVETFYLRSLQTHSDRRCPGLETSGTQGSLVLGPRPGP